MKLASSGLWRPFRWLLLPLFLGGAVFAAENTWLSSLQVRQKLSSWLEELTSDAPSVEVALTAEPIQTVEPSKNTWLDTALFSAPASGWTLDSTKAASGSMVKMQTFSTVASASSSLPTALFSSGFVAYSPGLFGPVPTAPSALAATGTWISNASGDWSNSANWHTGVIADGAGNNANFNFLNITTNVAVNLDSSRTIGNLFVGDTDGTHKYTIGSLNSSTLTFDSGSDPFLHSVLQQSSTSGGDTVSVSILMDNDLDINNVSGAQLFTVSGPIAPTGGANDFRTLWFNNVDTSVTTAGNILVSGNITNGANGTSLGVVVAHGGTVTFQGTNSYTGTTSVDSGTLLINGNNSAATGTVFVGSGGTLGGTGTVGANVITFDGTITGATATTTGQLTLQGDVELNSGEGGGTYLANLSGALSDLLAITGSLILGNDTTLNIVGSADGVTIYTLATFASRSDVFETVTGIPSGYNLVYHGMDIQLVPIPEPATWIGGALALGAIGFVSRRKWRRTA